MTGSIDVSPFEALFPVLLSSPSFVNNRDIDGFPCLLRGRGEGRLTASRRGDRFYLYPPFSFTPAVSLPPPKVGASFCRSASRIFLFRFFVQIFSRSVFFAIPSTHSKPPLPLSKEKTSLASRRKFFSPLFLPWKGPLSVFLEFSLLLDGDDFSLNSLPSSLCRREIVLPYLRE